MSRRQFYISVALSATVVTTIACNTLLSQTNSYPAVEDVLVNNGFVRTVEYDITCPTACQVYSNSYLDMEAQTYENGELGIILGGNTSVTSDIQKKMVAQVLCFLYPGDLCSQIVTDLAGMHWWDDVTRKSGSLNGYNYTISIDPDYRPGGLFVTSILITGSQEP